MNKLIFKKYTLENKISLLQLLAFKWTYLTYAEIKEKFEWRYEQNPYNDRRPVIYVALNNEQVVGFRAFVVQLFKLGEVQYKVFNPADAIVHPDFRRMGIFSKLNETLLADLQNESKAIILNTSSNNLSTPGYLKQGWQVMNYVNRYGIKLNLFITLKYLFLHKKKNKKHFKEIRIKHKDRTYVFTQQLHIDDIVALNNQRGNITALTHIRDASFYQWRYSYQKDTYFYAYLYNKAKLEEYIIFRKSSTYQTIIEEYVLATKKTFNRLLRASFRHFDFPVIRTHVLSQPEKKMMKGIGFTMEPFWLMKAMGKIRLPFLVRPSIQEPKNEDFILNNNLDIRCADNWQLNQSAIH